MSCCSANYPNKKCPLRMSDGRAFTNYEPRCNFNSHMFGKLAENNIFRDHLSDEESEILSDLLDKVRNAI